MNAAVQSAHDAYRTAAELAPERRVIRVDFTRPARHGEAAAEADPVNRLAAWANREMDVPTRHLVAAGGAAFFLVAGAMCGAWMAG